MGLGPRRYINEGVNIVDVTDDGQSLDAVIWVAFTDGILSPDSTPVLTIAPGGIRDINGNGNALIRNFKMSKDSD